MTKLIGKLIIWVLALAVLITVIALMTGGRPADAATGNGLPAMGYNTWYESGATLTESSVLSQAQLMAADGLVSAGYDVMTLDDGWLAGSRTASGALSWNAAKFPHGMPWLATQLRSLGMSLGLYAAIGNQTCARLPGSYGHYSKDAATFKGWGVTFVKVDSCKGLPAGTSATQLTALFRQFGGYVQANGMTYSQELPVLMTVGSPPYFAAVAASPSFANMWRVAPDESPLNTAAYTITSHLADDLGLHGYASMGHWNDLDMLVPGTVDAHPFGWSLAQTQSQLSVWAQEASPLFVSTNLAKLPSATLNALKNPDLISIDQSGAQAPVSVVNGGLRAVVKGADGGIAVLLVNSGTKTAHGAFTLPQLHVKGTHRPYVNVWTGAAGTISGVTATLAPGATTLLVIR